MKKYYLIVLFALVTGPLWGQEQTTELSLNDLSAFRTQAGNWQIVGSVMMNPYQDPHQKEEETSKKKRKKRKKEAQAAAPPKALSYEEGQGVLLNLPNDSQKDNLITNWEHGDLYLELDVMMPKGSNSGIYLQGRYELQLLDSWGKTSPAYGDIGGIYRSWRAYEGYTYMGKAPSVNAAKAPGLWQHLRVFFQAPRFDDSGKKTKNARFVYVELNGVRIHENVEVPTPTGGPIEENEAAQGPIMIQGDHGPVAFKNIYYQKKVEKDIHLENVSYEVIKKNFETLASLEGATAAEQANVPQLSNALPSLTPPYILQYKGDLVVPETGDYVFRLDFSDRLRVKIGDKVVWEGIQWDWSYARQEVTLPLTAGRHPFEIMYAKNNDSNIPRLGWFSKGDYPKTLLSFNAYLSEPSNVSPIYVHSETKPRLLRTFLDFDGKRSQRLTHTIAVGNPQGLHFFYDLEAGNPVCVWRGDFLDATPMWHQRGDGSSRPRGAVEYLFTGPSLAYLADAQASFPRVEQSKVKSLGYAIDESTGRPVFLLSLDTLRIQDHLDLFESNNGLRRTLEIENGLIPSSIYVKLAEGERIANLSTTMYAVDQDYYIEVPAGVTPLVRTQDGRTELLVLFQGPSLSYSIIW